MNRQIGEQKYLGIQFQVTQILKLSEYVRIMQTWTNFHNKIFRLKITTIFKIRQLKGSNYYRKYSVLKN